MNASALLLLFSSFTLVKSEIRLFSYHNTVTTRNIIFTLSPIFLFSSVILKRCRVITGYIRIRTIFLLKTNTKSMRKMRRGKEGTGRESQGKVKTERETGPRAHAFIRVSG